MLLHEVGSVLITGYPFIKNNNNTSTTTKKLKLIVSALVAHPQRKPIGDDYDKSKEGDVIRSSTRHCSGKLIWQKANIQQAAALGDWGLGECISKVKERIPKGLTDKDRYPLPERRGAAIPQLL